MPITLLFWAIKKNKIDSHSNFEFHAVNSDVLFKMWISLKSNKACGFDGQPPKLIKSGAPVLNNTLLPIVNQSIASCNFPNDLKWLNCPQYLRRMIE